VRGAGIINREAEEEEEEKKATRHPSLAPGLGESNKQTQRVFASANSAIIYFASKLRG
jgi:hypothetical protein